MELYTDEYFMKEALKEAQRALEIGEVPVGAVVVAENRIIGRGHNQTEVLKDATAHAEMLAITAACHYLGAKYLPDCRLYVTLEPCVMCAGAIFWTQLGTLVYGAADEKRGFGRLSENIAHPKTKITGGVYKEESLALIQNFFQRVRNK